MNGVSPLRVMQFAYGQMAEPVLSCLIKDPRFNVQAIITPAPQSKLYRHVENLPQELLAQKHDVEVLQSGELDKVRKFVEKISPDLVVIASFHKVLPPEILELTDFINIHHGDLPRLRGRASVNWAIINGETDIKASIHQAVAELDAGPILSKITIPITPKDTSKTVYEKINGMLVQQLPNVLLEYKSGRLKPEIQDERPPTYNCTRLPIDGLIDWSSNRQKILDLTRALAPPFPGAYTFLDGKKIVVRSAAYPTNARSFEGIICGRVTLLNSDGSIEVLASDGSILISEIEYDGKIGPPGNWIKSVKVTLGMSLESLLHRISALESELNELKR